jgi:signal transduction histidine kinase
VSEIVRRVRGLAKNRAMEIQALDVNELIGSVLRLITPSAQGRKITLKTVLMDLPLVRGDPIHLQQVLLNLVLNAMDAMAGVPEGQRALAVSSSADGAGGVVVAVRDSGHGVPPALLLRIFDSFVTTKKDGMGLGLSIARSLVEAHGGRITAENNPEGGATFRFTLPVDGRDAIDGAGASAST